MSTIIDKLNKARSEFDEFVRNKQAFNYKYADLDSILSATQPALIKQGLSVHTTSELKEIGGKCWMIMSAILSDDTGQELTASIPMPVDKVSSSKVPAQEMGSTLTYGRRYVYCALLNLTPADEDIDGASVEPERKPAPIAPVPTHVAKNPTIPFVPPHPNEKVVAPAPAPIQSPRQQKISVIASFVNKYGKDAVLEALDISDSSLIKSWDDKRIDEALEHLSKTFGSV